MTDTDDAQRHAAQLWANWVTIWQSEIAAAAADREMLEAVQRAADFWAAQALSGMPAAGAGADAASGSAGTVAAPGPAAAAAALGGSHPALERWLAALAAPARPGDAAP